MNDREWARRCYARRKGNPHTPPVLPDEMTDAGKRMEAELQERRDEALKRQLQRSRLKRHKLYAVKILYEVRS